MWPRKYILVFYLLVAVVLVQLFSMTFKNVSWFIVHLPAIRTVLTPFRSPNTFQNQSTATAVQHEQAMSVSKQLSKKDDSLVAKNRIRPDSQMPITTEFSTSVEVKTERTKHAIKDQAAFTSKQQTEKTKSQNERFLQNQVPVRRTSITVISTKSTTHLSKTSKVLAPFTASYAVKNQVTADPTTKELATFTSKQQTERMKSQNQATIDSIAEEPATFTSKQLTERLNDQVAKDRFRPDSKMLFITEFSKAVEVKTVDVLLIILTYHKNFLRRKNIRRTWLTACRKHEKIDCWFFTDSLEVITDPKVRKRILKEEKKHKDMIFTPIGNGVKFGMRFLHLLMWGKANYDFKYIIRADDDIMICIDHLMWDLSNFPSTNLHYGWMHCNKPNIVYIDEGFSMYSNDLVEIYLSQKGDKILCHPFGDQQVAVWEHSLGIKGPDVYKPDNNRIHHQPPASYHRGIKNATSICDNFIAVHGVYKNDVVSFWKRRGDGHFNKYPAKKPSSFCRHHPNFNITVVDDIYNYTPKACSSNPRWTLDNRRKYNGRER